MLPAIKPDQERLKNTILDSIDAISRYFDIGATTTEHFLTESCAILREDLAVSRHLGVRYIDEVLSETKLDALEKLTISGNKDALQAYLAKIDLEKEKVTFRKVLYWAKYTQQHDIFRLLLETIATPPNVQDDALLFAVLGGCTDIAMILATNPISDFNVCDRTGATVFISAAESGQVKIIRKLLADDRVDPNRQDKYGHTALIAAASAGQIEVIRELLADVRTDPNISDSQGNTALMHAVVEGKANVVKTLLADARVNPNISNSYGYTPLNYIGERWFFFENKKEIEALLTPRTARPNSTITNHSFWGHNKIFFIIFFTVFLTAMVFTASVSIFYLMNIFAKLPLTYNLIKASFASLKISVLLTPFTAISAVFFENLIISNPDLKRPKCDAKQEYKNKSRVEVKNDLLNILREILSCLNNKTSIPFITSQRLQTILAVGQTFVEGKSYISEILNDAELSQIEKLAITGDVVALKKLLENIDLVQENNSIRNALYLANMSGKNAAFRLLLDKITTSSSPMQQEAFMFAALGNCADVVERIAKNSVVNLNVQDIFGRTGLMYIAGYGDHKTLHALLSVPNRIDFNMRDKEGMTALIHATSAGQLYIVRQLLTQKNVDINSCDNHGNSALTYAVIDGNVEVITQLLAQERIQPNLYDRTQGGKPLLIHAIYSGSVEAITELLADADVDRESDAFISDLVVAIKDQKIVHNEKNLECINMVLADKAVDSALHKSHNIITLLGVAFLSQDFIITTKLVLQSKTFLLGAGMWFAAAASLFTAGFIGPFLLMTIPPVIFMSPILLFGSASLYREYSNQTLVKRGIGEGNVMPSFGVDKTDSLDVTEIGTSTRKISQHLQVLRQDVPEEQRKDSEFDPESLVLLSKDAASADERVESSSVMRK